MRTRNSIIQGEAGSARGEAADGVGRASTSGTSSSEATGGYYPYIKITTTEPLVLMESPCSSWRTTTSPT